MGEQNLHEYWRETFDRFKDGGILLERIEATLKDILQAVDQLHEGGFSLKHFAYKTLMSQCRYAIIILAGHLNPGRLSQNIAQLKHDHVICKWFKFPRKVKTYK